MPFALQSRYAERTERAIFMPADIGQLFITPACIACKLKLK
jgi:hypothetical protein